MDLVTIDEIRRAAEGLRGVARRTPLVPALALSEVAGRPVFLKLESLQVTGSFKIRGAYHRISRLASDEMGVVAASAGNHGQGVALAARLLSKCAVICTPLTAPYPKIRAIRALGARIDQRGETFEDALALARELEAREDLAFVPAYEDPAIIAGQGTLGIEILDDLPDVETVCCAVGGGGLISGIATAVRALRPAVRVVGVQAEGAAACVESRRRGAVTKIERPETMADGIRVGRPGDLTFAHIQAYVEDIVTVTDEQIGDAVFRLLDEEKAVAEGAGAAPAAALLAGKIPGSGPVVLVVSGGNVDPDLLVRVIERGLTRAGRYLAVRCRIDDRPGQLQRLLTIIARNRASVIEVSHHRAGFHLPLGWTEVELTIETTDPEDDDRILAELRHVAYSVEIP